MCFISYTGDGLFDIECALSIALGCWYWQYYKTLSINHRALSQDAFSSLLSKTGIFPY